MKLMTNIGGDDHQILRGIYTPLSMHCCWLQLWRGPGLRLSKTGVHCYYLVVEAGL